MLSQEKVFPDPGTKEAEIVRMSQKESQPAMIKYDKNKKRRNRFKSELAGGTLYTYSA